MEKENDKVVPEGEITVPVADVLNDAVKLDEGVEIQEVDPEVVLTHIEELCRQTRAALEQAEDPAEAFIENLFEIAQFIGETLDLVSEDEDESESPEPDSEEAGETDE